MLIDSGDVAQLGERGVRNAEARGSIPLISTIFFGKPREKILALPKDAALMLFENQGLASVSFEEDCIWTAVCSACESKWFSALKMQEQLNSPVSHPI